MSTIYFIISQAPAENPMIHFDHYYSNSKREILDHMLKLATTASQQYQVNGQSAKISPHDEMIDLMDPISNQIIRTYGIHKLNPLK